MARWLPLLVTLNVYGLCSCIRCYECDTMSNPACGVDFKSYQFEAQSCRGRKVKCGLQRQEAMLKNDKSVGILRRCYHLGQLGPAINESDGCRRLQTPPYNYTFEFCFCSEDYCNATSSVFNNVIRIVLCASLVIGVLLTKRQHEF